MNDDAEKKPVVASEKEETQKYAEASHARPTIQNTRSDGGPNKQGGTTERLEKGAATHERPKIDRPKKK